MKITVIIGNLNLLTDNLINIDNKFVNNIDIAQISNTIWSFNFDEDSSIGEIEFQNNQQNNNQIVSSLAELETAIGCTIQSIKDIHTANYNG
tara:strand:+ start:88 stop:363 length:276 start_codon:yes stop_codon:yes gene_type:complete